MKTVAELPEDFERVIVDSTAQKMAVAFLAESRLLEIARHKVAGVARVAGVALKQTFVNEGKQWRLKWILRGQRRILVRLIRAARRWWQPKTPAVRTAARLMSLLARCETLRTQPLRGEDRVYAIHVPEVVCISKGKARPRYKFRGKASLAVAHRSVSIVGARTFPGNP